MNRTIAFFWAGGPMSWMRYLTLRSFRYYHPDWRMLVYSAEESRLNKMWRSCEKQDFTEYAGKDHSSDAISLGIDNHEWAPDFEISHLTPVHQSDLFRWWWLSRNTGFYSDMDILYLNTIDPLADVMSEFSVGAIAAGNDSAFPIAFLAANRSRAFYREVLSVALGKVGEGREYQSAGCCAVCDSARHRRGSTGLKCSISTVHSEEEFCWFSPLSVYPFTWTEIDRICDQTVELPDVTRAIHWYAGAPRSQTMNRLLTKDNWRRYPCTFTQRLESVLR